MNQANDMDVERIFSLVDSTIPYSDCSEYQLLPLHLRNQVLTLGMVNPQDSTALGYLRGISVTFSYSLKVQPLDIQTLQAVLGAYINYRPTQIKEQSNLSEKEKPTLLIQNPKEYLTTQISKPEVSHASVERANLILNRLRPLEINPEYRSAPVAILATLPPQQLLNELLARVLDAGIGRVHLERYPEYGRVLWSQNGAIKNQLDKMGLSLFRGLLNEMKRLARLPLHPVQKLQKAEIARRYYQEPILLRLQLNAGKFGEEATLQVLRGEALSFYQKQQMEKAAQETMQLTQQLERKLRQISLRTQYNPAKIPNLAELERSLLHLQEQLSQIKQSQLS